MSRGEGEKLFQETTVQIEKSFGYDSQKSLQEMGGRKLLSSRFVLAEYKLSLVKDLVCLYSVIAEEESIADVAKRLAREPSQRKMARCLQILGAILEGRILSKKKVLKRLKRYVDWELLAMFEDGVEYVPDEIKCYVADAEPSFQNGTYVFDTRCTLAMRKCCLPTFIKDHSNEYRHIYDYIHSNKGAKPECPKIDNCLSEVLADASRVRGNNCKSLADCTISVEAPREATLYTSDKAYDCICKSALGKKVRILKLTTSRPKPMLGRS